MFIQLTGQMAKADFYKTVPGKLSSEVRRKLENMDKAYWARNRNARKKAA
ncbi:MAG TPA: hypothetical protein VL689_00410 [Paraburkholderia sp.]|jgi:hypothetical protein|nr:hypothetical protein [Paraburkholderia sp.]